MPEASPEGRQAAPLPWYACGGARAQKRKLMEPMRAEWHAQVPKFFSLRPDKSSYLGAAPTTGNRTGVECKFAQQPGIFVAPFHRPRSVAVNPAFISSKNSSRTTHNTGGFEGYSVRRIPQVGAATGWASGFSSSHTHTIKGSFWGFHV